MIIIIGGRCYYSTAFAITVVDCGTLAPSGFIIEPFNNTKFGALITFHCEENKNSMTAVCGSDGEWIPNPEQIECVNG